jgi:hypothetical protein
MEKEGRPETGRPSYLHRSAKCLHHPKKVQDDEDYNDYDQNVNPIARTRKAWTDILTEEAEQPQNYQNNNDCPQHIDFSF